MSKREEYESLFERIEKEFFDGWEDIYGTKFSQNQMVDKEEWFEFKKKIITEVKEQTKLD